MSTITTTFNADTSALTESLKKIEQQVGAISSKLQGVGNSFAALAKPLLGLTVSIGGVVGAVEGMKKAFEKGRELKDLSLQTGTSVEGLRSLQKAFAEAGLGAENTGFFINRLQVSMQEAFDGSAEAARAFARLRLDFQQLAKFDTARQFIALGQAIQNVKTQSEKADIARTIFGRSGPQMLALLNDPNAMAGIGKGASNTTEILARNAELFTKISIQYEKIAKIPSGFFTGLADKIGPQLLPMLEAIGKIDFSKIGQEVGSIFAGLAEAFKRGELGEFLQVSLELGFAKSMNFFVGAMQTAFQRMGELLGAVLGEPTFYSGMGKALLGIAAQFGAALLTAVQTPLAYVQAMMTWMGEKVTEFFTDTPYHRRTNQYLPARSFETVFAERQKEGLSLAGMLPGQIAAASREITADGLRELSGATKALTENLKSVGLGFKVASVFDTDALSKRFAEMIERLSPSLAQPGPKKGSGLGLGLGGMLGDPIADSLAKIGGGGNYRAFSPELSEAQKQTGFLERVSVTLERIEQQGQSGGRGAGALVEISR